ncbi:N-acetyl sugar amidotransferase [Candidatus Woesearchaeota archaeon]|nr:N-acetyl sugar amidotransferase [Candidatus Woesearchaeota archaeon]
MSEGKPLFEKLRYCVRCCMPATNIGMKFDELGICLACRSSEEKMHINWLERQEQLKKILDKYKGSAGNNYDCIIPVSGGKDSCFQLHVLTKIYGMKPLAVTFSHNWYSKTGWYNLWNMLDKLNVDHIMFTPNRNLINKLAKQSLKGIGDPCWHCHMGVGSFPLQVAVKFNIPLIIWGESIAEGTGRATYSSPLKEFDRDYFVRNSARLYPDQMVSDIITKKDINSFQLPNPEKIGKLGLVGLHLGDFIFWDSERQVEFIKKEYNWKEDIIEGSYKNYKSVECIMEGMHSYTKFLKRGFGRATDHASQDVRTGLLTREEGFELAKRYDNEIPEVLNFLLKETKLTEKEFYDIMKEHRKNHLLKDSGITEEEFQRILQKYKQKKRIDKSKELYVNNL